MFVGDVPHPYTRHEALVTLHGRCGFLLRGYIIRLIVFAQGENYRGVDKSIDYKKSKMEKGNSRDFELRF